jgi:hypothetical protein
LRGTALASECFGCRKFVDGSSAGIELGRPHVRNVRKETTMRNIPVIVLLACLGLAACGHSETTERTTVVSPTVTQIQPGSTIVVPPGTTTKVCPPGYSTC